MRMVVSLAGAVFGLMVASAPLQAQNAGDRKICDEDKNAAAKIAACSRLLNDRSLSPREREDIVNNRGVGYFRNNEFDRAVTDFSEAIRLNPGNGVLWANRADAYRKKKDFNLAISDSDRSIELNSNNKRNFYLRAQIFYDQNKYDLAIPEFTAALKLDPKYDEAYYFRGRSYYERKEFKNAIADFGESLKLDPDFADTWYYRGLSYWRLDDEDRAIADFTQALRLKPKYDEAFYFRGRSYFAKKDYKAAIRDLTESSKLDPKFADTWLYIGLCHARQGNVDEALVNYNKAIAVKDDHGSARHNRGVIKMDRGDYDGAIEDLTVAVRTSADEISHNMRGVAYRNKSEYQLAMSDFNEALRFNAKYAPAYYNRGMLHSRAGATELAVADLRKAVEFDPQMRDARTALTRAESMLSSAPPRPQQQQQSQQPQQQQQSPQQAAQQAVAALAKPPASLPQAQAPGTAQGGKRVALVIGNSNYQFSSKLANPGNDSQDIAKALRTLGFDVVEGRDLDRRGMDDALRQFARKLDGAGLAILFYSGHGVQVNERNYLIPIDARIERASDLGLDAVDVQRIIEQMEAEKRVNLIFLDACRDNPLTRSLAAKSGTRSSSASMGLAPIQSAAGTLIAYATQPNNVAFDGDGRNSPFTTALLKYMVVPGLEVELMMKQVRLEVMAATAEKQVPWGHSSLIGNVFLRAQ